MARIPRLHTRPDPPWDIRREGRAWGKEGISRYMLTPEKFEMINGKLFYDDEQRLTLLALLLENVGIDAAVRIGDPKLWRAAIDDLERETGGRASAQ
jgi:hypothetical protein